MRSLPTQAFLQFSDSMEWPELFPPCARTAAGFGVTLQAGPAVYLGRKEEVGLGDGLGCVCCNSALFAGEGPGRDTEIPEQFVPKAPVTVWDLYDDMNHVGDFSDSVDVVISFLPTAPSPTDSLCHLLEVSPCSGCLLQTWGRICEECQH